MVCRSIEATKHPSRITTKLTLDSALLSGLVNSAQESAIHAVQAKDDALGEDDVHVKYDAVVEDGERLACGLSGADMRWFE
jgi:hypothetical protein